MSARVMPAPVLTSRKDIPARVWRTMNRSYARFWVTRLNQVAGSSASPTATMLLKVTCSQILGDWFAPVTRLNFFELACMSAKTDSFRIFCDSAPSVRTLDSSKHACGS